MPLISSRKGLNHNHFFNDKLISSNTNNGLEDSPFKAKRNSSVSPYLISKKDVLKNKQKKNTDYYAKKLMKLQFWNNSNDKLKVVRNGSHLDTGLSDYPTKPIFKENRTLSSPTDFADGDIEDNDIEEDEDEIADDEEEDEEEEEEGEEEDDGYISSVLGLNKVHFSSPQRLNFKNIKNDINTSVSPLLPYESNSQLDKDLSSISSKWNLNKKFKDIFNKKPDFSMNILNGNSNMTKDPSKSDLVSDSIAREKVFQYVNETIDELWARFCDCSTLVEEEIHPTNEKAYYQMNHERSPSSSSNNNNYITNKKNISEQIKRRRRSTLVNINSDNNNDLVELSSELESSAYKLKKFRAKITRNKREMENLIDSYNMEDIKKFWDLWDVMKWECVKFMETDEVEEVLSESELEFKSDNDIFERCEETLNELEHKRVF